MSSLPPGATGAYFSDTAVSSGNAFRSAASFATIPAECAAAGMSFDAAHTVTLTEGNDDYEAANGSYLIFGLGGDDDIEGGNGRDCIVGGPGNDEIEGDNGDDVLLGGDGDDEIKGEHGNDYIDGGNGDDECEGGSGTNTLLHCEDDDDHSSNETSGLRGAPITSSESAPERPTGLLAAADGPAVWLQWEAVGGAVYYNIYRSETAGSGYAGAGSTKTPAFVDTDVKAGRTYYYVVTAVGPGSSQSRESNEAAATVPAPPQLDAAPAIPPTPAVDARAGPG